MTEVATAASELPEPSPLGAVAGVFVRPRETFESMRPHPRYWLPLILVVVAQVAFSMLVLQSGAVANDAVAKQEAKGAPPEQLEKMRAFFESPAAPVIIGVGGLVTMAFIILLGSGVAFFMGNLMMGGGITYRHYLSAQAHGAAIGLLDQAIRTGIAWSKGTLDIRLGLGNLLGDDIGPFGRMLDAATDPFILWSTAVVAIGISVYARKKFSFGLLAVLPMFAVGLILSALR
ncbi:MAG TPA: YIP1 family protein [Candidatus Eisenbacteria bacterium]|nr:YIP1 family protein [Candidatus Eisenbacteria bacterium]